LNNTEIFNDFDMVVSMTQKTINDQLIHLTRLGVIESTFVLTRKLDLDTFEYTYQKLTPQDPIPAGQSYLKVTELVPQVQISETGSNICFILEFRQGSFGMALEGAVKEFVFGVDEGTWQYGVMVRMDLATLAKQDIQGKKTIPPNVQDQLSHFCDNMFTVNSLFMDFQSVDLINFDPNTTSAGKANQVGQQALSEFMKFYLLDLIKDGNPYILGYSITPPKVMPEDSRVPDVLRPVGTTYTMYFDPKYPDLSNLNFCLVTAGGHKTIVTQPGNLDSNWISPAEQCDAKAIFGHGALIEPLILRPFYDSYAGKFFNAIAGQIDVNAGNSYDQAKSVADGVYTFTVSAQGSGSDHNQYTNSFTVKIDNKGPTTSLIFSGTAYMYKMKTEEPAEAWASGTVKWSGRVDITTTIADKLPVLSLNHSFKVDSNVPQSHSNAAAQAMKWLGVFLRGLLDVFSGFALDFLGRIIDNALTLNLPGLPDVSAAFSNMDSSMRATIMLPAGDVFYFKSPSTDAELNLGVPLTYKTQSTPAPAPAQAAAEQGVAA
jgi:hypothetical protein